MFLNKLLEIKKVEAVSGPKTPSQVLSGTNTRTFQAFDFPGYIKHFQER